jgi:hypothetical protein
MSHPLFQVHNRQKRREGRIGIDWEKVATEASSKSIGYLIAFVLGYLLGIAK